jgi:hypothetical protein
MNGGVLINHTCFCHFEEVDYACDFNDCTREKTTTSHLRLPAKLTFDVHAPASSSASALNIPDTRYKWQAGLQKGPLRLTTEQKYLYSKLNDSEHAIHTYFGWILICAVLICFFRMIRIFNWQWIVTSLAICCGRAHSIEIQVGPESIYPSLEPIPIENIYSHLLLFACSTLILFLLIILCCTLKH